jgi:hypothetical protein
MSDKTKPIPGKMYFLTGGHGDKCIANGNTWAESAVKDEWDENGLPENFTDKYHEEEGDE